MSVGPVLAIDVGTSSVRVVVVTPGAEVLDDVRVDRVGDTGHRFDAEALWASIADAIAALGQRAREGCTVVSVAAHLGTVLLDDRLRSLGPASGWSDRRGVTAFTAALGDDAAALLVRTGRPVPAAGAVAAVLDVRSDGGRPALAVSPKDFVVARLTASTTADVTTDVTSAAYTGALDVRTSTWSSAVLGRTDVDPGVLGRLARSVDVVGTVRDDVAAAVGLPRGLPVVAGGPDGTVGLTYLLAGRSPDLPDVPVVGDVAGTTDVVAVRRDTPDEAPASAVVNPFPLGGWTVGGPTGTTGGAVAHWAGLLGFRDTAEALRALGGRIESIPLGADGLRAAVALSGERFPTWDDTATAGLSGMTGAHRSEHVLRAVLEGGARAVADAVDAVRAPASRGADDAVVVLAGGTARSRTVARIRAQVLGRTVLACDEPDVTLMGAALIGAWSSATPGERASLLGRFVPRGTVFRPDGTPGRLPDGTPNGTPDGTVVPAGGPPDGTAEPDDGAPRDGHRTHVETDSAHTRDRQRPHSFRP